MRELVKGYALALRDLAREAGTASELERDARGVAELCERFVQLAVALDDRAADVDRRQGVLHDLVGERVSSLALRLFDAVVAWEVVGEVVHSLEELPELVASDMVLEGPGDFATSGRVIGYARAIFEDLGARDELEPVLHELRGVAQVLERDRALQRVLSGFEGTREARLAIIGDLFGPRVSVRTTWILRAAVATSSVRPIGRVVDRLLELAARQLSLRVATVRTARSLRDDEADAVRTQLERLVGQRVEVEWVVDESVIGGIVAIVGDRLWDQSVRRQLDDARRLVSA